jgi:hypothetical protein
MRVDLRAIDREFPYQISSFFFNFSSKLIQSTICNLLVDIGTLRYLIGKMSILQLKISAYMDAKLLSPPTRMISFLLKFIFRPDICS